ncbi:hypothetical protein GBA52_008407 [Prunus armeniaca]|nr:hypothetical protein GBA52_008407 [Prunus armeniaca]
MSAALSILGRASTWLTCSCSVTDRSARSNSIAKMATHRLCILGCLYSASSEIPTHPTHRTSVASMSSRKRDCFRSSSPMHSEGSRSRPGTNSSSVRNNEAFGLRSAQTCAPTATMPGHLPWSYTRLGSSDVGLHRAYSYSFVERGIREAEAPTSAGLHTRSCILKGCA